MHVNFSLAVADWGLGFFGRKSFVGGVISCVHIVLGKLFRIEITWPSTSRGKQRRKLHRRQHSGRKL